MLAEHSGAHSYATRPIAQACETRVDFMAVAGMKRPEFRTMSDFRKCHLQALHGLLVQVVKLRQWAGSLKLVQVAFDGTKVKANASVPKAMTCERMRETGLRLTWEVRAWSDRAKSTDEAQDRERRRDHRGDQLPAWVAYKKRRITKVREVPLALKAEAQVGVAQCVSNCAPNAPRLEPMMKRTQTNTRRQTGEFSAAAGHCGGGNLAVSARHHHQCLYCRRPTAARRCDRAAQTQYEWRACDDNSHDVGQNGVTQSPSAAQDSALGRFRLDQARSNGFRPCLLQRLSNVQDEWSLGCVVHNPVKPAKALIPVPEVRRDTRSAAARLPYQARYGNLSCPESNPRRS